MQTRVPLRLAWREVRRRPGRTALAAALVALPVCAMVLAIVLSTDHRSGAKNWEQRAGQADATLEAFGFENVEEGVVALRRKGARVVDNSSASRRILTADGRRLVADFRDLPLDDPITDGMVVLRAGRPVGGPDEVVLSVRLAQQLHRAVDQELELASPPLTLRVVGIAEFPGCLDCNTAVVQHALLHHRSELDIGAAMEEEFLIDLPDSLPMTDLVELRDLDFGWLFLRGGWPEAGTFASVDFGSELIDWNVWGALVLGGVILLVAGIVISAAFSIGARRQVVTIGQLAAGGMEASVIRSALVLQGTLTGLIGVVVGVAAAAGLLGGGHGRVEQRLGYRFAGYHVGFTDILLVAVVGVGAASIAALIPARSAARMPIVAALAGRRPLAPVSARQVSRGVALTLAGLTVLGMAVVGAQDGTRRAELWGLLAIAGGAAELLGACLLAPVLVSRLEPLAGRLRGAWRVGTRSLARQRSRSGAVIGAVAAAGALAVFASSMVLWASSRPDPDIPPSVVVLEANDWPEAALPIAQIQPRVIDILGGADAVPVRTAAVSVDAESQLRHAAWRVPWPPRDRFDSQGAFDTFPRIADPAVLDALRVTDEVRSSLARDGLTLLEQDPERDSVSVETPQGDSVLIQVHRMEHTLDNGDMLLLITPQLIAETDLVVDNEREEVLLVADHRLTEAERGHLEELVYAGTSSDGFPTLRYASPRSGPSPLTVELILSLVALSFALLVIGTSLALAAAEARDERDVLAIAGAAPAMLARLAGVKAWVLATVGGAMAIPVGLVPMIVLTRTVRGSVPSVIFPTRTALVLVVLVPLVVATVAWMASATAQWLRPVRVSTATFE